MTSALIEIRPSNETEESTSPERQFDQDTRYCELRSWDIAPIAEDLDVSWGISPFERPELGPWLTAPELALNHRPLNWAVSFPEVAKKPKPKSRLSRVRPAWEVMLC
jgi:hypothetical protein